MIAGCDYSIARPDPALLAREGIKFVCRYLPYDYTNDPAKFVTRPEIDALHAHGIDVVANFESTNSRALSGGGGGAYDGKQAVKALISLGFPRSSACYVSVDFDVTNATFPTVQSYLLAFKFVLETNLFRFGIYGGSLVYNKFPSALVWQSAALSWSSPSIWDNTVDLQQRGLTVNIPGTDGDRALVSNFGQWAAKGENMIYTLGIPKTVFLLKGTEYWTDPFTKTSSPSHVTPQDQRFLILGYNKDGSLAAINGLYNSPNPPTVPILCGWVSTADFHDVQPLFYRTL